MVCEIKLHLEVQVWFSYTSNYTVLTSSADKCASRKNLAAFLGFYTIEKVLLVFHTSREQQNPTWNTAIMCRIPPPLLHHRFPSPFLRQTNCRNLVCEKSHHESWLVKNRILEGGGISGYPCLQKDLLLWQVYPFLFQNKNDEAQPRSSSAHSVAQHSVMLIHTNWQCGPIIN